MIMETINKQMFSNIFQLSCKDQNIAKDTALYFYWWFLQEPFHEFTTVIRPVIRPIPLLIHVVRPDKSLCQLEYSFWTFMDEIA